MSIRAAPLIGAAIGVVVTATWWYGFACTSCDPSGTPAAKFAFAAGLGALLAGRFSRDWGPPPDPAASDAT
jgi:hypothetical protein